MVKFIKTFLKFFGQALISAALVFILISAPARKVLSVVKYTLDSSDILSGLTSTGVFTIGSDAVDSFLRLYPTDTVPCAQEGAMYYDCSSVEVKFYNGSSWIGLAESAEASGQIVMFDSACPSGWTEVTAFQNKFPRGHDGDATYCETGGSDTASVPLKCHSHTGGAHTHCIPELGQHFCYKYYGNGPPCPGYVWYYGSPSMGCGTNWCGCMACGQQTNQCSTQAGGEVATSSCGDCSSPTLSTIPAYREVVFCKKD